VRTTDGIDADLFQRLQPPFQRRFGEGRAQRPQVVMQHTPLSFSACRSERNRDCVEANRADAERRPYSSTCVPPAKTRVTAV